MDIWPTSKTLGQLALAPDSSLLIMQTLKTMVMAQGVGFLPPVGGIWLEFPVSRTGLSPALILMDITKCKPADGPIHIPTLTRSLSASKI